MQEKPLLLPSAKTAVLVRAGSARPAHYVRMAAIGIGVLCVLVGAADVTSRLARSVEGSDSALVAFGPAVALQNPGLLATSLPGVLTPARLKIPSLGVDAGVETVGKKADGTMGTPQNFDNVGWYSLGAKPGEAGTSVFAGHVNNALMKQGVFENLSKIKKGDYVTVSDASGRSKVYRVSTVSEYAPDAPTEQLFSASGPSRLVLITCDGDWVPADHSFDKRLVVVADAAY
jgi:sortase A